MTGEGQSRSETEVLSPAAAIFLASVFGLFLELALIRWVSSEIRVFAYCKNLVLVASFLGFGTGCFLWRRQIELGAAMFLLLLLALLIRLPWFYLTEYGPRGVSTVLAELSGFMIFRDVDTGGMWNFSVPLAFLFAIGWTTILFFAIALVMVPFGQVTARNIDRLGTPLRGYSINVAGSLAGILGYTFVAAIHLPPLHWFAPIPLAVASLSRSARERGALFGITIALLLVLMPADAPNVRETWSAYQKLSVIDQRDIVVNNIGYQMIARLPIGPSAPTSRFTMPYQLGRPVGRVLIVGAGSGNDAAAALGAGAASVTAVEIDPVIYRIGLELHPWAPYSNERVRVVVDDARHFLKASGEKFDLIVFSHLDSHTLLSSFTTVRLDNYIYTVDAFREARSHLADGGVLYVSFYSELPFIGERLSRNLTDAFGHAPLSLEQAADERSGHWRNLFFLSGEPRVIPSLEQASLGWAPKFTRVSYQQNIAPSTDDWPFLPLERPGIPAIMLLISAVIIVLSATFAWIAKPVGERFDGRVFWLGAAFMLVEVHNVSRLALVFGTTWQVNAWVVGAILVVILFSNAICDRLRRGGRRPGAAAAIALFASLGLAYFIPMDAFLAVGSRLLGGAAATLVMTLPIFFAGLVFADAFAESSAPAFALAWNVLGAVAGGMAENVSYVFGISALLPTAALFYALAILRPRSHAASAE